MKEENDERDLGGEGGGREKLGGGWDWKVRDLLYVVTKGRRERRRLNENFYVKGWIGGKKPRSTGHKGYLLGVGAFRNRWKSGEGREGRRVGKISLDSGGVVSGVKSGLVSMNCIAHDGINWGKKK